jgi:hypothetical protein
MHNRKSFFERICESDTGRLVVIMTDITSSISKERLKWTAHKYWPITYTVNDRCREITTLCRWGKCISCTGPDCQVTLPNSTAFILWDGWACDGSLVVIRCSHARSAGMDGQGKSLFKPMPLLGPSMAATTIRLGSDSSDIVILFECAGTKHQKSIKSDTIVSRFLCHIN